jgi:hypothetical protein
MGVPEALVERVYADYSWTTVAFALVSVLGTGYLNAKWGKVSQPP